jgi:hypothetical protein
MTTFSNIVLVLVEKRATKEFTLMWALDFRAMNAPRKVIQTKRKRATSSVQESGLLKM